MFVLRRSFTLAAVILSAASAHAQTIDHWTQTTNSEYFAAPALNDNPTGLSPTPAQPRDATATPSYGADQYAEPSGDPAAAAGTNRSNSSFTFSNPNTSSFPPGAVTSVVPTPTMQPGMTPEAAPTTQGEVRYGAPNPQGCGPQGCGPQGCGPQGCGPQGCGPLGCGAGGCDASCGACYEVGPGQVDALAIANRLYNPQAFSTAPTGLLQPGWGLLSPLRGGLNFYVGMEWLQWYTRGMELPPLVTTSPLGTPSALAGVRGEPGTRTLFGDRRLDTNSHSGGRYQFGLQMCGLDRLEFEYFTLGSAGFSYAATSPFDYDILARPVYDTFAGAESSALVGFPGEVDGTVAVNGRTNLDGYVFALRRNLLGRCQAGVYDPCGSCGQCNALCGILGVLHNCGMRHADLILGIRSLDLDESVSIRESLISTGPAFPVGTAIEINDRFRAENQFYGLDFGLSSEWYRGRWGIGGLSKIALGNVRQRATIAGDTTIATPGSPAVFYDTGGLLALPSNIGDFDRDEFSYIAEVGLKLYYNFNCHVRASIGYSLIYLPEVVRPGGLIDLNVDPRQQPPPTVTGATSPARVFRENDFWAQGLSLGLEFCR